MNKKKKIIGVVAVLVVGLAIAIPVGRGKFNLDDKFNLAAFKVYSGDDEKSDEGDGKSSSDKEKSGSDNDKSSDGDNESGDINNDGNTGSDSNKDSVSNERNQDNNASNKNSDSGSSDNNATGQNNGCNQNNGSGNQNTGGVSKDGSITDFDNTGETINDNYEVNDADIKIQHINSYSGIFIEDGSDVEVDNVAAIQVKNTSKKALEFAQIQIYNGNKKLVFDVSSLPANSSAVIMEKNKAPLDKSKSITYGGTTGGYTEKLEKVSTIKYQKVDNNGIKVTNKSNKNIPCVRIFYKYKSSEGYYIGGITYTAKINNLKAGASQTIYPSHFDSDGGEIMMIKTYTTAQ